MTLRAAVEVVDFILFMGGVWGLLAVNDRVSAPGEFRFGSMVLGFFAAGLLIGAIMALKEEQPQSCVLAVIIALPIGIIAAVVALAQSGAASWPHIGVGVLALVFVATGKFIRRWLNRAIGISMPPEGLPKSPSGV
ncbi:MAG: hypothetical protein JST35_10195 [Armatimonadetes bacterium]|nr:hypothetical protein [Armatimonadota bacterium]